MKRVFTIGERVWFNNGTERGWGRIVMLNKEDLYRQQVLSDDAGSVITVEHGDRDIDLAPSAVFQVAEDREFRGSPVVWVHLDSVAYQLYCPDEDEYCDFRDVYDWVDHSLSEQNADFYAQDTWSK